MSNRQHSAQDWRWIGAQIAMFATGLAGGAIEYLALGRGYVLLSGVVSTLAGMLVLGLAALTLSKSARDLDSNLTAAPTPVDNGRLVDSGIYSRVRHPMYTGVLLWMLGWSLVFGSWLALAITLLLVPFLHAKSRHEEALLRDRYSGYTDYTRRVRNRFIPYVL